MTDAEKIDRATKRLQGIRRYLYRSPAGRFEYELHPNGILFVICPDGTKIQSMTALSVFENWIRRGRATPL